MPLTGRLTEHDLRSAQAAETLRCRPPGTALPRLVGARRRVPLRPGPYPRTGVRGGYPAAHRIGLTARRPCVQLHPGRRGGALPAHARQARVLPDGLGRQRPAHRTAGAELLPRALRAGPALRARPHVADGHRQDLPVAAARGFTAQLHRAVRPGHRRGREGVHERVADHRPVGGLARGVRHHRRGEPPPGAVQLSRPVPQGASV